MRLSKKGECKKLCVKIPIYGNKTFLEVDKFNLFFIIKYYHNLINFQISNRQSGVTREF